MDSPSLATDSRAVESLAKKKDYPLINTTYNKLDSAAELCEAVAVVACVLPGSKKHPLW